MRILEKEILAEAADGRIIRLRIASSSIPSKARPGQFAVVMVREEGERIPLTIVDHDRDSVTLIVQEVGLTTKLLGRLKEGDLLYALVGPLGHPTEIKNYGSILLVGGGVGIAELYPVAKALKRAGNRVTTILGARTKGLLILESELRSFSDEFHITTDDGSCGRKGFTTDILEESLKKARCDLVYIVGPIPMMRKAAGIAKGAGVKALASLNALMVDATGMCGCCRVTIGDDVKFTCVDGPEFDAAAVDWDELTKRNKVYEDKEKHICESYPPSQKTPGFQAWG